MSLGRPGADLCYQGRQSRARHYCRHGCGAAVKKVENDVEVVLEVKVEDEKKQRTFVKGIECNVKLKS